MLFSWIPLRTSDLFTLDSAKRCKEIRTQPAPFSLMIQCWCELTSSHAVEVNSDRGGLHRVAAGQATQHRLNGETSRFLAIDDRLLLQLYGFEPDSALCGWKEAPVEFLFWIGCIFCMSELLRPLPCLTAGALAAGSRQDPGMSGGDWVLAHESTGCTELLLDLPISLSAESTSLSLHPVHNLYL